MYRFHSGASLACGTSQVRTVCVPSYERLLRAAVVIVVFLWQSGPVAGSPPVRGDGWAVKPAGGAACPVCGTWLDPRRDRLLRTRSGATVEAAATQALSAGAEVHFACPSLILELGSADLIPGNLLDLQGKTIRFTPDAGGYRVQTIAFAWDASFGTQLTAEPSHQWALTQFQFPFSNSNWNSIYLGTHGNITFGADQSAFYDPFVNRFLQFRTFAGSMTNTVPIIAPLFRKLGVFDPDGVNRRYAKELFDRLVVTWEMSEPYRDVFAFTSNPRMNRFQAVLHSNGTIDFSYDLLQVQDGVVGVFPLSQVSRASWSELDPVESALPGYIDATNVALSVVSPSRMRATFVLRDGPLPVGDPVNDDMLYRVFLDTDSPYTTIIDFGESDADLGVFGDAPNFEYFTYSPHVDMSTFVLDGRTLSFDVATAILGGATTFSYFADTPDFNAPSPNFDHVAGTVVQLPQVLGGIAEGFEPAIPAYVDMRSVAATLVGNHSIRFTFTMRGELPPRGDPQVADNIYRVFVDLDQPFVTGVDFNDFDFEWGIFGDSGNQHRTFGPGISPDVQIDATAISFLAPITALQGATQFAFFTDSVDFSLPSNNFDQANAVVITLPTIHQPNIDLTAATASDPAREVVYEAFHYPDVPQERQMTPPLLAAVGDRFDFLAYYTDFRIDRQETSSFFSGAIGNLVSGVVPSYQQPAEWGSAGRLQGVQAVNWIDTPIAAESGVDLSGTYSGYNREITLLSHELGHRWLTLPSADVGGNIVAVSDPSPHWLLGLHAPALFTSQSPSEASFMGGAYWQDNGNGMFTNLTQPFFQAGGYSPMDLYFMGLLEKASVPSFFLIQNLNFSHFDGNNKPVYTGTRLNLGINQVTAVTGDRSPAFANSQKRFNVGLIGVVQQGAPPSHTLLARLAGIRDAFTTFWGGSTGHVGRMVSITAGDYDADSDVDGDDLDVFAGCRSGPAIPQSDATCRQRADLDDDGDADHDDFGCFQRLRTD